MDWILYCPHCRDIKSLISSYTQPPEKWNSRFVAGFRRTLVDVNNDTLTCSRKSGPCGDTELKFLHAFGRDTRLGDKMIVVCVNCANLIYLHPTRTEYNSTGVICVKCAADRRSAATLRIIKWWRKNEHSATATTAAYLPTDVKSDLAVLAGISIRVKPRQPRKKTAAQTYCATDDDFVPISTKERKALNLRDAETLLKRQRTLLNG